MCAERSVLRLQAGLTLVELVLAIAILAAGVAGLLGAFTVSTRASADPMVHKQMLSIAEQVLEEIALQPFAPVLPAQVNVPGPCAARTLFNDVLDYQGLQTTTGFCDVTGTALPALAAYNVRVAIDGTAQLAAGGGQGAVGGGSALRIAVTVTHGSQSMTLFAWRTAYAAGL